MTNTEAAKRRTAIAVESITKARELIVLAGMALCSVRQFGRPWSEASSMARDVERLRVELIERVAHFAGELEVVQTNFDSGQEYIERRAADLGVS